MTGSMEAAPLPPWARAAWALALCVVLALHLSHARVMSGRHRWWHLGHTAMAAGMVSMYALPRMGHEQLYRAGLVVFALLTLALLSAVLLLRRRDGGLDPLWVFSAADMLVMTCMLLPPARLAPVVEGVLVAYLAVQTVAWALGLWERVPAFRAVARASVFATGARTAPAGGVPGVGGAAAVPTAHSVVAVRLTLAVMSAGMAFMLAAM
ncbi:DUF5134 domain-containing protein [Saccharomonospora saliphila]|uniref:DUF5134 domain-containing protein n=1 Tax=Saccharomonospora saliphila TaxID=369829 RepID=UPI0003776448|nr:DUF5134 domain-containing protein [Saccharomonospora saliphila]